MPFPEWFGSGQNEAEFLRRVLDHVSDCLVAVDTNGRVVLINAPYCRLLGGPQEDFIGRHITDVVSPKTRLHHVARGDLSVTMMPLEVRGHQLLARQVPVYQDERIIGAVGLALFSNMAALKKAVAVVGDQGRAIHSPPTPWTTRYGIDDILGQGTRMDAVRAAIEQAAPLSLPVLVQGETGSGKELAANAIHALSPRARRPFVWVNCASIPESLIDAELFGYEGGAFTGARTRGKPGKFELASGGTLFLDEIGDMPLSLQASLLRAVQNQEIVRVGGVSPIPIDTRVVCATHRDLQERVDAGQFRADLYYRLNVLGVHMPALRERDDLEWLAEQLLERIALREGLPGRRVPPSVRARWQAFDWPGNVRQLEAALLRFLLSGEPGLPEVPAAKHPQAVAGQRGPTATTTLQAHLDRERDACIQKTLAETAGDKDEAARRLGISRATLYRELRRSTKSI
ncbi:Fis family transcriptional regulator [Variovorax sp. Root318D1]|uniref:sigma-54 interaction domain-containing protein n=1 Tax=Variovorax sp. Root318D1 TaxID=1736513 RepID=UPI000700DCB5|nr:sigma 54-interacting transcriptional regulator [Variovorax sp. Root318D1]KQU91664.1 Fis family transcriptional regulator [Variovorax sp. Root318D1]